MENQPMQFLLLEQVQFLKVQDDSLLQWELVDVVDAEEEQEQEPDQNQQDAAPVEEIKIIHQIRPVLPDPDAVAVVEIDRQQYHYLHGYAYEDDEEQVVDDEEDDDDRCDLDDELVPWEVGNKLGRQRMKKLGKRACSKMKNSKRSPYLFVRPGCVGGKHGLGLKHSF
ncbi:uncharacterized protein LOC130747521 [Lotus japonicus]|uniref:CM0216.450.nc protein n=1 Tax=Lotus japonicus TaxID=34305 RepID=B0BL92_LOTJA|nr:uncharacterized protein LOC130747521 [Lotus japonicus]AFK42581.1 unknown [Lotus japonicus]BAF98581.1 CM0216.450.nc [Lotus japonicus]